MANKETEEEKKAREMIEEMATTIAKLSRQISAILDGRMKRESIITLLAYSTKMPRKEIDYLLSAIENMEEDNLKK